MSSEPRPVDTAPRKLHRAGIVVLAVDALREAALPMLVVGVVAISGGGLDGDALVRALMFAAIGAIGASIAGAVTWSTTTWRLTGETVRMRTGLLSTKIVDIPLPRVQSVDTVRGPIQRLFGVQGVHIQTAGGGKEGEIKLVALAAADVEALRAAVGATRPEAVSDEEPEVVRRLTPARAARGRAHVGAGRRARARPRRGAAARQRAGGQRRRGRGPRGRPARAGHRRGVDPRGRRAARRRLAAGDPRRDRRLLGLPGRAPGRPAAAAPGLVARRESTVAVPRVQAVLVVEGVLRRPFGLATLRVEVAGFRAEAAAAQTLFPLLRRRDVPAFLAELLPEHADGLDGLAPPPPRAWRRYVLPPALAGLVLGAAGWVATRAPGRGCSGAPGRGRRRARRAAGWRLEGGRLAMRSRRLARITVLGAGRARLQEVERSQSLLQRRGRLADLAVAVGAGTRMRVRHLDEGVAAGAYDALRRGSR